MWRVGFAISGTLLVGVLTMNIQYKQFELLSASKYAGKDFGTLSKLIAASGTIETVDLSKLKPVPMIRDPYSFSAVAVDHTNNEVILADENLFQIAAYDRAANNRVRRR
jgi:hypothetical protein